MEPLGSFPAFVAGKPNFCEQRQNHDEASEGPVLQPDISRPIDGISGGRGRRRGGRRGRVRANDVKTRSFGRTTLQSSVKKTGQWIIESGQRGSYASHPTSVYRDFENPASGSFLRLPSAARFPGQPQVLSYSTSLGRSGNSGTLRASCRQDDRCCGDRQ